MLSFVLYYNVLCVHVFANVIETFCLLIECLKNLHQMGRYCMKQTLCTQYRPCCQQVTVYLGKRDFVDHVTEQEPVGMKIL